jgi:ATP-dependent protease ClpP protease subunit
MPKMTNNPTDSKLLIGSDGKTLLIYGVIGDWWDGNDALTLAQEIDSLLDANDELNVRIHSPGGYLMEGLVVYNRLKYATKPVNVHIDGMAASMASVIALAGDKVTMPSNAWLMIHKPINSVYGNADDMRKMADTLDGFESDITNIYMERFTGTREELSAMLEKETWINAQDALAYGFIDEIVEPVKAAAAINFSDFENAPAEVRALFGEPPATTATSLKGEVTMPPATTGQPAQTTAVQPGAVDVAAAVNAALEARANTNNQIQTLATSVRLSQEETSAILSRNLTIDQAREAILEVVAKRDAAQQPVPHVTVSNNNSLLRNDIAKGLMAKAGLIDRREGNDFTQMSLIEIARTVLVNLGISVNGMNHNAIATQAMHSTSDFPNILADVANKSLRAGYDAYPRTFLPFTRRVTASDFKYINRAQLGEAPALEKVNEKGEFKYGSMGDGKERYKLETYGKIISLTRQTIIDDDLDAFTRVPQSFGDAAADLENSVVWGLITNNAKLSDNKAIFHADHANLGTAGAPSETTLSEARKLMRLQKAMNGTRPLNLRADFMMVPAALETVAQKLLTAIMATATGDVNTFAKSMELIVEPLLDASSTTAWYTAASPNRIDTIEYAYLAGEEGVYIETENGFDVDGVRIKAVLDFGAGAIDYRGLFKNAGA